MGNTSIETIEAPHLGMNTETLDSAIPKGQCQSSTNLLPGFPGRAPLRGPMTVHSDLPVAAPQEIISVWSHPSHGYLATYVSPYKVKEFSSVGAAAVDRTPADTTTVPGRQFAMVGNTTYGVGLSQDDGAAAMPYVVGWGGGALVKKAHGPRNGVGAAFWLNRLFVLANCDPDSVVPGEWALYWSDPLDGVTTFLTDAIGTWQDNVSGLTNKVLLPEYNDDDPPIGLAVMGRHLAVFGYDSIHVLRGSGPSDWQIRKEISALGCVDARSIVSVEDAVYFASESGFYSYDGVTVDNLAKDVKAKFQGLGKRGTTDNISTAQLSHDYLLVTMSSGNSPVWSGIVYLPTRSWTTFAANSNVLAGGSPLYSASGGLGAVTSDGMTLWSVSKLTAPTSTTYDVILGLPALKYGITGQFVSRLLRLGEPAAKSQLRRFVAGRKMQLLFGVDDLSTSWTFMWQNPSGDTLTDFGVPDTHPSYDYTRRDSVEAFGEADELAVVATLTGPNGSGTVSASLVAELHDCFLEYEVTRRGAGY